jgi:hypothetical protein
MGDGTTGTTEMVVGNSLMTNNFSGAAQAVGNAFLYSNGTNESIFKGPAVFIPFPPN